jgi:alkylation response protein AidB-like acyl-CoA dehydrogenase
VTATDAPSLHERVAPLLPLFAAEAERADRERRLPQEVVASARAAGLFRLLVPRVHGGLEAALPDYLALLEDLAGACGSLAWCVAVCGGSVHALAVQFPPETARGPLEAAGGGAIVTGTLPPLGTAAPQDGGYVVNGRWPFASLTEHADLRIVGAAAPGPPGEGPDPRVPADRHLRYCLVPAGTPGVTLHDTWRALAMQGSGSLDLELANVFVPAPRTAAVSWRRHRPDLPGVLRVPFAITQGLSLAAISCGIARTALDLVIARARAPRGPLPPAAAVPSLQLAVADAAVDVAAGRAVLARGAEAAWARCREDTPIGVEERTPWWIAAHGAARAAVHAVETLFAHSGAHALYDDAPLQRCFRDVRTAHHHIHLHPGETAQEIGRALLGLPPERVNW